MLRSLTDTQDQDSYKNLPRNLKISVGKYEEVNY